MRHLFDSFDFDRSGLSKRTAIVMASTIVVALLHHFDHVLRVDHSGWPFRPDVNPFTFSLLAYPIGLFALFGPKRLFWVRWTLFLIGVAFTIFAHAVIESPAMQFAMWAHNQSIDPRDAGSHNLLGIRSSGLGTAAVLISMTLNVLLVIGCLSMLRDGMRRHDDRS
jgi:hypothetical protein